MNESENMVLQYLQQNAIGAINAKTADTIQAQLDLPDGRTQEPVREIIRKLVVDHNALSGSNRKGYFIIDDEEDLGNSVSDLTSRAHENMKRADALTKSWNNRAVTK